MNRIISFFYAFYFIYLIINPSPVYADNETVKYSRRILCDAVEKNITEKDFSSKELLIKTLYKASEISDSDTKQQKLDKVSKFWRDPLALDRKRHGLYCDAGHFFQGTILWRAAYSANYDMLHILISEGADINMVDNRTNETLLDNILKDTERWSIQAEQWTPPLNRSVFYFIDSRTSEYHYLRTLGAKHSWELNSKVIPIQEKINYCLTTQPDDIPTNFSDYSGGLATQLGALTPKEIPGVTTVSVRQAGCLINAMGKELVVLAPMNDAEGLPGAYKNLALGAKGTLTDDYQKVVNNLISIFGKERPVLVYCHSENCFLSYNAALRLLKAGSNKIYWMRDGLKGWRSAEYPLVKPKSTTLDY